MATMRALLETRERIRAELTAIHAASNGEALGEAPAARWAALTASLAENEAASQRQSLCDDLDRRSALGAPVGDARWENHARSIGMLDTIRAQIPGNNGETAGRAREVSAEIARRSGRSPQGLYWPMNIERRVVTSGAQNTAGEAASLVPTVLRGDLFVDRLRNATVVRGLGATVLSDLNGNIDVPRRVTSTNANWFAENTPITQTDATYDKIGLRPKHVGALTELSLNMVQQNSPDVEALTQNDLALSIAEALDSASLFGSGDGVTPLGVLNTPNVARVSFGGAAPTWSNVLALQSAVDTSNVAAETRGFVGSSLVRSRLMSTPRVSGAGGAGFGFLLDGAAPMMLAGDRFVMTNSLPVIPATTGSGATPALSALVYGDWSALMIGIWGEGGLDLSVNPFADASYRRGNVMIRAILTADCNVRHAAAFAVATDVAA